jgi:hypothetical protein
MYPICFQHDFMIVLKPRLYPILDLPNTPTMLKSVNFAVQDYQLITFGMSTAWQHAHKACINKVMLSMQTCLSPGRHRALKPHFMGK